MSSLLFKQKHTLIALSGISPAVITETVYALCMEPSNNLDEVLVITTKVGRDAIRRELLESGVWQKLQDQLKVSVDLRCHVAQTNEMLELDDVSTQQESEFMADTVLSALRENVAVGNRITLSIAGGRKTMSAIGALAMTLLGRKEDRLCHILVNEPFENPKLQPRFYFPEAQQEYELDGTAYSADDAVLKLYDLPFVHCGYWFQNKIQYLPQKYKDAVDLVEMPPEIKVYIKSKKVRIGSQNLTIESSKFYLLCFFAYYRSITKDYTELNMRQLGTKYNLFASDYSIPAEHRTLPDAKVIAKMVFDLNKRIKKYFSHYPGNVFAKDNGFYGFANDFTYVKFITSQKCKEDEK